MLRCRVAILRSGARLQQLVGPPDQDAGDGGSSSSSQAGERGTVGD